MLDHRRSANKRRSTLHSADVFGGAPTGGAADAIAAAFAWLVSENVAVINASLVGPDNTALGAVVKAALAKGVVIFAAVGNDGPSAPPLFPASYDGVIGVTAVDEKEKAIVEAARGVQVDFAAPGADMTVAGLDDDYYDVHGTSFGAPIVAGLAAKAVSAAPRGGRPRAGETRRNGARSRQKGSRQGLWRRICWCRISR